MRDIFAPAVEEQQRANRAAYLPPDCPTREKHGWLGDAQVTAEEAMYNFFSPAQYRQRFRRPGARVKAADETHSPIN